MAMTDQKNQSDETDTDEKRWEERLKRVARAKDVPVPPPPGPLRTKVAKAKPEKPE
jgi:hypothetical protein